MGTNLLPRNEAITWGGSAQELSSWGYNPSFGAGCRRVWVCLGQLLPLRVKMHHSPACSTAFLPRVSFKAKDSKAR